MSEERIRRLATGISAGRVGAGMIALASPRLLRRVMGLPASHHSASTDMVTRLFGVREVAVGAHAISAVRKSARQPGLYALNAAVDGGDAVVMLVTAIGGGGARRAAVGGLLTALPVVGAWLCLRRASQAAS